MVPKRWWHSAPARLWEIPEKCRCYTPPPMSGSFLDRLGPGLITGAADDDPSGIATYSQAGAQFGLGMLWSVLLRRR